MKRTSKTLRFNGFRGDIVRAWRRSGGNAILVSRAVYRGRRALDLREWCPSGDSFVPTKRGIRFHDREVKELLAAMAKLKAEVER